MQREGDPAGAIAVALVHDRGARISAWLGAVLDARLPPGSGPPAPPAMNGMGAILTRRAATPEEATKLIQALASALTRSITEADVAAVAASPGTLPVPRTFGGAADAAVGACSGELGESAAAGRPSAAELDAARRAVASTSAAALSAVGTRNILDAAEAALAALPPWEIGSPAGDPWPTTDLVIGASRSAPAPLLSVALRVDGPARVIDAARRLGEPDSPLALRAERLDPPFRVERILGIARPRGGCLRLDLAPVEGRDPGAHATGKAAALALVEARRALAGAKDEPWALEAPVLGATDPAAAARVAAWNAIAGQAEPGPERVAVHYAALEVIPEDLPAALRAARDADRGPTVEVRSAVETGQGEMWLLAGSTCATDTETVERAGAATLMIRALAHGATPPPGVELSPWVSAEGLGLLAHGPPLGPAETAAQQAARLGDALGRAILTTPLDGTRAAETRLSLLGELSPELGPLWPHALSALSSGRPSWLDPRGTWQAVSEHPIASLDAERRAFVRGPLRLAVIARAGGDTVEHARSAFERWLAAERGPGRACGARVVASARPGRVEIRDTLGGETSRALVGVAFRPAPEGGLSREAEWTATLLRRQGGWLDRALGSTGLATGAEVRLLGGGRAAALVVELSTTGDAAPAAEQVRGLFARLAEGAATREDAAFAEETEEPARQAALLDPRIRLVRLFVGRGGSRTADLASLRRFHAEALAAERHVVVVSRPSAGPAVERPPGARRGPR